MAQVLEHLFNFKDKFSKTVKIEEEALDDWSDDCKNFMEEDLLDEYSEISSDYLDEEDAHQL